MAAQILDFTAGEAFERRQRLRECIARMAEAIATGECTPLRVELEVVLDLCHQHRLPTEAARVSRWMSER